MNDYSVRLPQALICDQEGVRTVLAEDRRGDEVLQDAAVPVKRADHLTPNQELADLLRQLPQFLTETQAATDERRREAAMLLQATRGRHYNTCHEQTSESCTDFEVDVSVGQPGGAAFVQEVDVFDEEAEEGNHDLQERHNMFSQTFPPPRTPHTSRLQGVPSAASPSPGCCAPSRTSGWRRGAPCGSC